MGEFGGQAVESALCKAYANNRVVSRREDRAKLDEKPAFACRDRRESAPPPELVNVALANRSFELHARAERRA